MSRQVEDLLAAARRSPVPLMDDGDVDLRRLLAETAEEFQAAARLRPLSLRVEAVGDLVVTGDHDALKRAVGNLVDNAVRLAPAGSQVVLAAGREGAWQWVAVADQGPGTAPAEHARVFERAWSADGRGSGLGLAIVRQIAEWHGGAVHLHSDSDSDSARGSVFVLWLPTSGARGVVWAAPAHDPLAVRRTGAG